MNKRRGWNDEEVSEGSFGVFHQDLRVRVLQQSGLIRHSPVYRTGDQFSGLNLYAGVAQLVELGPCKTEVACSSHVTSSKIEILTIMEDRWRID